MLLDTESKRSREILSADPGTSIGLAGITRDGRRVFSIRASVDSDIWRAALKP